MPTNTPRGRGRPQQPGPGQLPHIPWAIVWAVLLLWLLLFYFVPDVGTNRVPYSEFKTMMRRGDFQEVILSPKTVRGVGESKPGAPPPVVEAVRVDDPALVEELEARAIRYQAEAESVWGPYLLSWLLPIAIMVFFWWFLLSRMGGTQRKVMAIGRSRAKVYIDQDTGVTLDDVAGVDEAKEELQEIIDFLRDPAKYRRLGGRIPKGALLVGPPGTGKTLLAKAVAGEAKVPFFSISGSEFVEMFVGVGAARVRDLFEQAQNKAPCIIFIDELDALGRVRSVSPIGGGNEEREHTLQQLLVEMDGFDTRKGVIILAATNRPEILDPALLRPGRFDRHVLVDRPDIRGREDILRVHCQLLVLGSDVDLKVLAARTPGFVGADLANVANEAALLAARRDKNAVEMTDFEEAINRLMGGLEKKRRVMNPHEQEVIAYHESGHALTAESLEHADRVHRISIIPRGIAALGYTLQLPTEDRYLITRSELLDRMTVLLGGRAAEELAFREISTGAQDDLERATTIGRSMVVEYGMSERLGPQTYERARRPLFLDPLLPQSRVEVSEETAREIDCEVRVLVTEAHKRARNILAAQHDTLDTVAHALLEKETLEGDELRALIASSHPPPAARARDEVA